MSDYTHQIEALFDQCLGDYEFNYQGRKRYLFCPLSCQGYSKHRHGHFEVNFKLGICYCYKCVEGSSIYNMLLQFKNTENRVYINGLLRDYNKHYNHENFKNNKKILLEKFESYSFTSGNFLEQLKEDIILTEKQFSFLKTRFPTLNKENILHLIKKFNFYPDPKTEDFYYISFFNKFKYQYLLKNGAYVKGKNVNTTIVNDKKDYYYNNFHNNCENLYLAEGLIDLMTIYELNPLLNSKQSNFLAFCNRNYSNIYEFLLNTGIFFYKNVYLIVDNDVNRKKFIMGVFRKLKADVNNSKYMLFKNFYIIEAPHAYTDINHLFMDTLSLKDLLINKIN